MILLPIKPEYAFAIQRNEKKVEFRKMNFRNLNSDICIVYASSPYKKIIWYFKIKNILEENTKDLWSKYKAIWWIKKKDLDFYYKDKEKWYVIEIAEFFSLEKHVSPKDLISDFVIPQSFKYLNDNEKKILFYDLLAL